MKVINTTDPQHQPPIVMLVYGEGGVGKTTFASTAPAPIIADCENGSKYFGLRGISTDVAVVEQWSDMREFFALAKDDKYQTIVIDPIGELMEKLKSSMITQGDSKLVQKDGNPTMAGWGWLKDTMRKYIKALRDTGKNVLIVAHLSEKQDEDRLVKRPEIQTKLADDLVNIVDIVGYMTTYTDASTGEDKRVIVVDPASDKMVAKDRTGQLGRYIPPNFAEIIDGVRGNNDYAWMKEEAQQKVTEKKAQPAKQKKAPAKAEETTEPEQDDQAEATDNSAAEVDDVVPVEDIWPKNETAEDVYEQLGKAKTKQNGTNKQ